MEAGSSRLPVTMEGAKMGEVVPVLRVATVEDIDRIGALMRESVLGLFPGSYDSVQTASAAVHVAHVDPVLITDGTYFVCEVGGELVACGGWSRRGRLYTGDGDHEGDDRLLDPSTEAAHVRAMFVRSDWTRRGLGQAILEASRDAARAEGFRRLDLGATLPGVPLYRAFGFREVEPFVVTMPDGVALSAIVMERPIE
jgi:GNAT superfamily N-acetyltransferase